jgi:hypothetical protein
MGMFKPVSRFQPLASSPPPPLLGDNTWPEVAIALGGFDVGVDQGPYIYPNQIALQGFAIGFSLQPGQVPNYLALGGFDIQSAPGLGADSWIVALQGFDVGMGAGAFNPSVHLPVAVALQGFGMGVDPFSAIALEGFDIQSMPASLPTRTVTYCYNLRAEGIPMTTWVNWPFKRIVRVNGTNYASHDGVMYQIGGETDDGQPINSSVTFAPMAGAVDQANQTYVSRCRWVHAGTNTEGNIYAGIDVDGSENYQEWGPYPINKGRGNQRRAQLGFGLSSGLWQFRIDNREGERLKIHTLTFDFQATSRRI